MLPNHSKKKIRLDLNKKRQTWDIRNEGESFFANSYSDSKYSCF